MRFRRQPRESAEEESTEDQYQIPWGRVSAALAVQFILLFLFFDQFHEDHVAAIFAAGLTVPLVVLLLTASFEPSRRWVEKTVRTHGPKSWFDQEED